MDITAADRTRRASGRALSGPERPVDNVARIGDNRGRRRETLHQE
ncbi:hypothetical protein [Caballeronia novacaledonica]|uniref:Uncharacterized protein n=1 Tax=Caballeronia novacaledonica TaxID=1544861 RepID=A0AA37IEY9_9BURK|nr:hypothetical protein [Caballeronia novacaledonica]GJH27922.1 hypothetical protein CBA19CS42_25420 [Caballeronia novacaledonica]